MKTKIIDVIAVVLFILSVLITVFDVVVFNEDFYDRQYQALNTSNNMNMSHEDLMLATDTLLDYIKHYRDDINVSVEVAGEVVPMFNQREIDHMVDVKNLFARVWFTRIVSVIVFLIITAISLRHASHYQLSQIIYKSLSLLLFVIGGVGLYALIDFSGFWIVFHKTLFNNDLWLLNPATDRMINMFPEVLFNRLVMRVLFGFVSVFGVSYFIGKVLEKSDQ